MKYDKKIFEDGGMVRFDDCRFTGWLRRDFSGTQLDERLDAAVLPQADVRHDGRKVRVVCVGGVFVKLYKCRNLYDAVRRRFKTPRSLNSLAGAVAMQKAGVATPPVLAALRGRGRYPDLLITEAAPADAVFCDRAVEKLSPEEAAAPLCNLAARMHARGIVHGDLSLRNLYFYGGEVGVIDLDGCRVAASVPPPLRRREAARLASSYMAINCGGDFDREVAQAFRKAYCAACGFDPGSGEFELVIRKLLAHGGRK
ncbi:MAG: lipopolysaccharide kinase InaA family protein [Victivallaceae bacterium]|nr:lipopolysaccharide kinase InaA family protein [Victivallaceae bacterium]